MRDSTKLECLSQSFAPLVFTGKVGAYLIGAPDGNPLKGYVATALSANISRVKDSSKLECLS